MAGLSMEPLGRRERACACVRRRHLLGAQPAPLLAQAQGHISGLSVELDDEHLLLSDLLSLLWFCMCPAMNFKLVGGGPSSQSASYFFVGEASVSVRKEYLVVISVGLGSLPKRCGGEFSGGIANVQRALTLF